MSTRTPPPDLRRIPDGFVPASLDDQIRAAESALFAYWELNVERVTRAGRDSDGAWARFNREMHRRKSVLHTLLGLKRQQDACFTKSSTGANTP